jgi:diguanylate cyclase (GGDEF)-like protein
MPVDAASVRHVAWSVRVGCVVVLVTSAVVLVGGYVLGYASLRNIVPGTVAMKPLAAVGLLAAGLSLLAMSAKPAHRARGRVHRGLALVPLVLGAAVLGEYIFSWRLGIDELLFVDHVGRRAGIAYPGRFAPTTAVNLVLVGAALLAIECKPRHGWRPAEVLVLPAILVACMSIIGYAYGIPAFYGPASAAKMALNTAVCFLALGGAIILARPHGHILRLVTTDDPGGVMIRRIGPLAVLMPLTLGWMRLAAGDAGVFADRAGTWWLTAATIGCFVVLIWRVSARLSAADAERRILQTQLERLASHDSLTGLFNRHHFDGELIRATALGRRYGRVATLLIIDLDRMKPVNDEHGHRAGDAMLRGVADVLRRESRTSDIAARMGGDEFALLLPETDAAAAEQLSGRVLEQIRSKRIACGDGDGVAWTTASIGIAALDPNDAERTLADADAAMYVAKRDGGDRFVIHHAERADYSGASSPSPALFS